MTLKNGADKRSFYTPNKLMSICTNVFE